MPPEEGRGELAERAERGEVAGGAVSLSLVDTCVYRTTLNPGASQHPGEQKKL